MAPWASWDERNNRCVVSSPANLLLFLNSLHVFLLQRPSTPPLAGWRRPPINQGGGVGSVTSNKRHTSIYTPTCGGEDVYMNDHFNLYASGYILFIYHSECVGVKTSISLWTRMLVVCDDHSWYRLTVLAAGARTCQSFGPIPPSIITTHYILFLLGVSERYERYEVTLCVFFIIYYFIFFGVDCLSWGQSQRITQKLQNHTELSLG